MEEGCTLKQLYGQVGAQVPEADGVEFFLSTDPAGNSAIPAGGERTLRDCGVGQGQMLFLHVTTTKSSPSSSPEPRPGDRETAEEDSVDILLATQDGRIARERDRQYCQHGVGGMCAHCQPLEPYDAGYAEQKGIKHLSLHAYLRKLGIERPRQPQRGGTLEEPSFRVRSGCPRHPPYPRGICSQCQPSAITLNPQPFRFVDHVEFASPALVEGFLAGWRTTGYQRFGWLYGRYEPYAEVPLGIKAVVQHIYEPPQDGSIDGFQLAEVDPGEALVDAAAAPLDLQRVGMIYTDLRDDGTRSGKVEQRRGADTFFLSSAECIFVAEQQRRHPNPCRHSPTGRYGSKFVTVVLSGDAAHNVELFPYQVSVTTVAMVEADLIRATTDPALMMVMEGTPTHYVPDVIYKYRSEHGSEVQALARPTFPVEYLIVSLSHGFPREANPLFTSAKPFKLGRDQAMALRSILAHLRPVPANDEHLLRLLSDFGLFVALWSLRNDLLSPADLELLAQAIRTRDLGTLRRFVQSDSWQRLLAASAEEGATSAGSRVSPVDLTALDLDQDGDGRGSDMDLEATWTCSHCTFDNPQPTADSCEVCGLPRRWDH